VFQPEPGRKVSTSVSIGYAQYRPDESRKDFIRRADEAMYSAKMKGKDRICAAD
jgi:PleD family two-component response regulator